jgi:hypothetical protein
MNPLTRSAFRQSSTSGVVLEYTDMKFGSGPSVYNNINIGTATADREVVIVSVGNPYPAPLTGLIAEMGGVTPTKDYAFSVGGGAGVIQISFWRRRITSGTTTSFFVDANSTAIFVYTIKNLKYKSIIATAGVDEFGDGNIGTIRTEPGGVCIGGGWHLAGSLSSSITGLSTDYNQSNVQSGIGYIFGSTKTTQFSNTIAFPFTNGNESFAVVSYS